ncbi:MAG: helix-turn-helix transcriptional regulator [Vibrio sp.]
MSTRKSDAEVAKLNVEILKRIPEKRKVTAKEIFQQLESHGIQCSYRTVQRRLEELGRENYIEIDDTNKPYGYRMVSKHPLLSATTLSPQEALLLNLAHDYLSNLLPPSILKSLDGFFAEAKYQLNPSTNNAKEREWLKKVKVVSEGVPMLPPEIDQGVFEKISEALYHNRLLNIDYYNSLQQQKSAQVMPLGLAQQGQRLYLVCRFDGYTNERNIAVHRVKKATVSTFGFERPAEFRLNQYDESGHFGFAGFNKCKIDFCISKYQGLHILETPLSADQKVIEHGDHYQIQATVIDSLRFEQWLRGFGKHVWDIKKQRIEQDK